MATKLNGSEWGTDIVKEASPGQLDPYVRLSAGVLVKAAEEARAGDAAAAEWLMSETAALMAHVLGVNNAAIERQAADWARQARGKIIVRMFSAGGIYL